MVPEIVRAVFCHAQDLVLPSLVTWGIVATVPAGLVSGFAGAVLWRASLCYVLTSFFVNLVARRSRFLWKAAKNSGNNSLAL